MTETDRRPQVEPFLDSDTETWSYVVYDRAGGSAAVIDAVLDFDQASGRTSTAGAERIVAFVRENDLTVEWVLETHAHADHLSAAPFIREQLGGKIAIGDHIRQVQGIFRDVFNLEKEFLVDGSQFDHLFHDGDTFKIGDLEGQVIYVPGHTPADMAWLIGDALFVGDTLFLPDVGSARCDFPGGDARALYKSVHKLLALPEETRMFMCHDYPPNGTREHECETTVGAQKRDNIHLHEGVTEDEFVKMRSERDATLGMPRLILPSIQVNIRAGQMPPAEDNGTVYLKVPINKL
ncbi:MBL fold metallo-hydrolase [Microbulbifer hydrolyticus]|uniref:Glyoxylase-like metal-dependent hydrolase (Beta-lactamase superfamily II) n=2 Tax=Microbulbifer hydrolyticus TaxID=48074 RepID=A0A6P1TAT3_9GAMM|nr:MBL fold metallo-hydrolase [Microbulbifer hydrolyticus]MBB5210659.1 glyoxylase-like metal-dependent hydrolase (beta-lactamase superfamily II) [Microbulbifer hydrolyticus]QHQ38881.1 MBL fold metallo-hydrolase [Microbulbifer hydrolyticus]